MNFIRDAAQVLRRNATTPCDACPLRDRSLFKPFSQDTLSFMKKFKMGEMNIDAGATLLSEGSSTPQLYTALSGMGLRYKTLENGERQVISFVLPGDFIGMQANVMGEMQHSVEATTEMTLCVFNRKALWDLFRNEPERALELTWLAAVEEHFLGETLAALGQRSGTERVAWALLRIFRHLSALGLMTSGAVPLPFRQQDLADALGLSLVHTNKTLSALRRAELLDWRDGLLHMPSVQAVAAIAGVDLKKEPMRPLI